METKSDETQTVKTLLYILMEFDFKSALHSVCCHQILSRYFLCGHERETNETES